MIKLTKDNRYPDMCHCCHSKKDVFLLRFEADGMPSSNLISICKQCLKELKNKINETLEEE